MAQTFARLVVDLCSDCNCFPVYSGLENPTVLFIVSCIAIIPLAGWMGKATEHLAEHMGQEIGGLLNATFGNAAELIIALFALSKGLEGVVKASITGSIIGNMLLVLGLSLLAGGAKFKIQKFNRTATSTLATALTLAAIALLIPTVFHIVADNVPVAQGGWTPAKRTGSFAGNFDCFICHVSVHALFFAGHAQRCFCRRSDARHVKKVGHEEEEAGEHWSKKRAGITLLISTAFVALISEFLVGAVEAARGALGFTEVFVGVIVVAIIGNAAEHSSAILMAMRNKMDLSLGIALGSSLQIALFVAPILLFASYFYGFADESGVFDSRSSCGFRLDSDCPADLCGWRK